MFRYGFLRCPGTCNHQSWLHSKSSRVLFLLTDHHIVNDTYGPSSRIVIGIYVILWLRDPWSVIVSIGCLEPWYFLWCMDAMVVCVRFMVMDRVILLSCLFPWCVGFSLRNGLYLLALFVSHGILFSLRPICNPPESLIVSILKLLDHLILIQLLWRLQAWLLSVRNFLATFGESSRTSSLTSYHFSLNFSLFTALTRQFLTFSLNFSLFLRRGRANFSLIVIVRV